MKNYNILCNLVLLVVLSSELIAEDLPNVAIIGNVSTGEELAINTPKKLPVYNVRSTQHRRVAGRAVTIHDGYATIHTGSESSTRS